MELQVFNLIRKLALANGGFRGGGKGGADPPFLLEPICHTELNSTLDNENTIFTIQNWYG